MMKSPKSFNFLNFIKKFNLSYTENSDQENNLSHEERKQLYFSECLIKELGLLPKEYRYGKTNLDVSHIKDEHLVQPFICNGGTCAAGMCPDIGKITKCDTGCTYPGA